MEVQTLPQQYQLLENDYIFNFSFRSIFEDINHFKNMSAPDLSNFNEYSNLENKVAGFKNLQTNWDSYNADTISETSIYKAIDTLSYLYINGFLSNSIEINVFPMSNGGIRFEFENKPAKSELEIDKEGILTYFFYDESDGFLDEIQIFELSELSALLKNLPNETKRASLAGTMSDETAELFREHLKTIRNEWE